MSDPATAFAAALGPDWRGQVAARLGLPRQSAQRWGKPRWPAPVLAALESLLAERATAAKAAQASIRTLARDAA
jgi:hypothetical protein